MEQLNVPQPRFGRSGNAQTSEAWGDVDNFDVDMLAEYLLDDGNLGSGVTFDFNVEGSNQGSTVVSPENSEDGVLPPIAEMPPKVQSMPANVAQSAPTTIPKPAVTGIPLAPAPATTTAVPAPAAFPTFSSAIPTLNGNQITTADAQKLIYYQHDSSAKRQRVEAPVAPAVPLAAPILAVSGAPAAAVSTPMINNQQLAAAAAQAMQQQQQGRGRKKSQAQIDRRRERNRILARRTRLRKKFFFESLQKEVMDLQRENVELKDIVKTNIRPEISMKILNECDAMEKMPESVLEACGSQGDMASQDFNLVSSIQKSQHSFIITDPSLQDNPIVFASDDFLKLTGYSREQVLGRNCRFLQGTETSKEKVEQIRKGIASGEDVGVTLINYMADGTPFWNKLFIASLRDAQNNVVNYIGVTVRVAQPSPGDPEHGKQLPVVKTQTGAVGGAAADATVRAIEGAVSAAVAASGTVS